MRVIGVNGSPRKMGNTAAMLDAALMGARSAGADTERVDLYDLDYKGCKSCFACKLIGGASYGRCALRDELSPVLDRILGSGALILASPVYFGDVSGMTRCFLERLWFPSLLYRPDGAAAYKRDKNIAIIYTMNVDDPAGFGYERIFEQNQKMFEQYVGKTRTLIAKDTLQFNDYAKYESAIFDPKHKKTVHDEQFPKDCASAFRLGAELADKR